MVVYWPNKQGISLNTEVAHLFFYTKQKFYNDLYNNTSYKLYLDILDNSTRSHLFSIVLIELEIIILDIIELDLKIVNIRSLSRKILYDLVQKSVYHFLSKLKNKCHVSWQIKLINYLNIFLSENQLLIECLLIYLIFGSASVDNKIFMLDVKYTPKEYISVLLENLIIQISNLVIFITIENIQSLSKLAFFVHTNSLCNASYISIRSLALFRNTLLIQGFIYQYFHKPKEIYGSRYKVWLISSQGLICKYIIMNRIDDFAQLSNIQLVFIFFTEIQDLIIPQLEKFLLLISKIILYIFVNLLGNSIIFIIRAFLTKMNDIYK